MEASERHPDLEIVRLVTNSEQVNVFDGVPTEGTTRRFLERSDEPAMDRIARLMEIETFASVDEIHVEDKRIIR